MERDSEINVLAVFCGHTHENHLYYDVHIDKNLPGYMDNPYEMYKPYYEPGIWPTDITTIYFTTTPADPSKGICDSPAYIETEKST